jgi:hypothetical protein
VSSKPPSEPLDLEHDIPTSPEDIVALARLRHQSEPDLLVDIDRLSPPSWLPPARDLLRTSKGWKPFVL